MSWRRVIPAAIRSAVAIGQKCTIYVFTDEQLRLGLRAVTKLHGESVDLITIAKDPGHTWRRYRLFGEYVPDVPTYSDVVEEWDWARQLFEQLRRSDVPFNFGILSDDPCWIVGSYSVGTHRQILVLSSDSKLWLHGIAKHDFGVAMLHHDIAKLDPANWDRRRFIPALYPHVIATVRPTVSGLYETLRSNLVL